MLDTARYGPIPDAAFRSLAAWMAREVDINRLAARCKLTDQRAIIVELRATNLRILYSETRA